MGADDELRATVGNSLERFAPCGRPLAATEPGRLDAQRLEPFGEGPPVLLREQLGGRHDRGLHATGDRSDAGDRSDDGLARADVALDQAHHRMRAGHVAEHLVDDSSLRVRQLERELRYERLHRIAATSQRYGGLAPREFTQVAQAQVMREQLLEHEPQLAGVFAGEHVCDIGVGGWPVQIPDRVDERRQIEPGKHLGRQQLGRW